MDLRNLPPEFYRVSVKAILFDDKKRLLVVQDADGLWEIPGGGLEKGEEVETGLKRELEEELQLTDVIIDPVILCFYRGVNVRGFSSLKIAISVRSNSLHKVIPSDGMMNIKFVTRDKLLALPMNDDEAAVKEYAGTIWASVDK